MGPRIYPSYQDTNLNAKGTLIISLTTHINRINIYRNGLFVDTEYKIKDGLCTIPININDVIRIESSQFFSIDHKRWDYTTDYENGDDGIKITQVVNNVTQTNYTFTATTIFNSYNFEYRSLISLPGPTPTPTPTATNTPTPTPTLTPTPTPIPNCPNITTSNFYVYNVTYNPSTGYYSSGDESVDLDLGPDWAFVTTGFSGSNMQIFMEARSNPSGQWQGLGSIFYPPQRYVTYQSLLSPSFVGGTRYLYVRWGTYCGPIASPTIIISNEIVMDRLNPPLPPATPTPTPTPTPTIQPLPTGSLFYYDPGNIASYPGSGSILYDLSGNGRHANINTGITWVSGSAAYFDLNGNDNNSITGATLSQTLTSWSMWIGIQRDTIGDYDGFMTERTAPSDINGIGAYSTTNRFDLNVNNTLEITEPASGRMITGSWMFLGAAVDNTTYTTMVYKSGSIDTYISGSKSAGSSNFNNAIVLGEDKETGADRTMDGRIGPSLMYDRKLSTSELTVINDYFKSRYGI